MNTVPEYQYMTRLKGKIITLSTWAESVCPLLLQNLLKHLTHRHAIYSQPWHQRTQNIGPLISLVRAPGPSGAPGQSDTCVSVWKRRRCGLTEQEWSCLCVTHNGPSRQPALRSARIWRFLNCSRSPAQASRQARHGQQQLCTKPASQHVYTNQNFLQADFHRLNVM